MTDEYLFPCVIEIYDHRPIDYNSKVWNNLDMVTHIRDVASCATLVSERIITAYDDDMLTSSLATLLYSKS